MSAMFFYTMGVPVLLMIIVFGALMNYLLKVRLKKVAAELKDVKELPPAINDLFNRCEKELTEMGFGFSHCQLNERPFVIPYPQNWMKVYFNPKETTYAAVAFPPSLEITCPYSVEFITIFSDNRSLNTVSGISHNIIGSLPNTTLLDPYTESLKKQWECHLKGLAKLKQEVSAVIESPVEFVAGYGKRVNDYVDELELKKWARKVDSNEYHLTFKAAFFACFKAFSGMFKHQILEGKRLKAYKADNNPITFPVEVETQAFYNRSEMFKGRNRGRLKTGLLFLITLVLFSFSFGFLINFKTILILIVVIFFHELGHFLGMLMFGQRNSRILFIPFIGAATLGMDKNITAHQRMVIYFLGPIPGIILGLLILFTPAGYNALLSQMAVTLLFINYFNLLPIMPLDGGQIVNLFLSRLPGLQVIFLMLCGFLAIIASRFLTHDFVFLGIGIFLIIAAIAQRPIVSLLLKLRREIKTGELEVSENVVLPEIFRLLNNKPFDTAPFERKYVIAKFLLENSIISLPSIKLIVFYLMLYLFIFVMPVIAIGTKVYFIQSSKAAGAASFYYGREMVSRDKNIKLLPEEEALGAKIGFDQETLLLIKQVSRGKIRQFEMVDENNQTVKVNGVLIDSPSINNQDIVFSLRFPLLLSGYLAFAADNYEGREVGILKGNDQFEIVKVMNTDGINYGHNNKDVIAKLKQWMEKYPFDIIGAGIDWVEIEFREVPKDLNSFSKEVYDFCPDSVEQGVGSIGSLEQSIKASKRLFLWWD